MQNVKLLYVFNILKYTIQIFGQSFSREFLKKLKAFPLISNSLDLINSGIYDIIYDIYEFMLKLASLLL